MFNHNHFNELMNIHDRRMFPTLRVSFTGLNSITSLESSKFNVLMDIVPVDTKRYRSL